MSPVNGPPRSNGGGCLSSAIAHNHPRPLTCALYLSQVLCSSYFSNYIKAPMHAFRPTLDQGGLPAEALGQLTSWTSPVIYHVNSFDEGNPDAGPDDGWDVDTIYNKTVTVTIDQVGTPCAHAPSAGCKLCEHGPLS